MVRAKALIASAFISLQPVPSLAREPFFPIGVWGPPQGSWTKDEEATFFEDWFGSHLAAMGEKPLWTRQRGDPSVLKIRVLFLPSFEHPGMVRIEVTENGSMRYDFRLLSGAGGYEPGSVIVSKAGVVDAQNGERIEALEEAIQPFNAPSKAPFTGMVCMDGTEVVLEVADKKRYNVLQRHECELTSEDPLRGLVKTLDQLVKGRLISPMTFEDPK